MHVYVNFNYCHLGFIGCELFVFVQYINMLYIVPI